ncbi:ribosome biogenesis protein Nop16 [Fomes fomentarius]|nr:ribosome biogenesis protein Nop16 [Fomes fomentarius]
MGNPRQRRKLRSGSHKPVQHSRRAKKLLKKQAPIRGPKVLQEAWDGRKTVRQNYEALGLAASLNPIASGGAERTVGSHTEGAGKSKEAEERTSGSTGANGVRKGFGKIIRDAEGKIVDVEMGDENEEEEEMTGAEEDDVLDGLADSQLAGWVGLGSDPRKGSGQEREETRVVQALEQLSASAGGGRVRRFASTGERGQLQRLVGRYGEDVEAMARDRKMNAEQRTAGELRRAIRKAGGFVSLGVGG